MMGSVKDLIVIESPERTRMGRARFVFSDRYSVFDWGKMPDEIPDRGKSLCITAAYFFEILEREGIRTHYIGLVEDGEVKNLSELKEPQRCMEIKLLRVLHPTLTPAATSPATDDTATPDSATDDAMADASLTTDTADRRNESKHESDASGRYGCYYDYTIYRRERANFLIPLEVIYRNSLPEGSSVFRRLRDGSLKPEDLNLSEMPKPGQILQKPFIDVSTKLESHDRYLRWDEAKEIAALSDEEVEEIKRTALKINDIITREVKKAGLRNEDGKIEFGFDENRKLIVVDAVGTLDECRFTYNGMPVSKEIARIFYRKTKWYEDVSEAKRRWGENWREFVRSEPPPLPKKLKYLISSVYKAACNEITGRKWFDDTPKLREIMDEVNEVLEEVEEL